MANKKELLLTGTMRRHALACLTETERRKYELARELGLLEKVREVGWAGLSAKETGRIGGLCKGRKPPCKRSDQY